MLGLKYDKVKINIVKRRSLFLEIKRSIMRLAQRKESHTSKLKVFCGFLFATLIVASASFVVFAMSRDRSVVGNSLTVAENALVTLTEDSADGFGKKEITFTNNGSAPMLIRVSYSESWNDSDGFAVNSMLANGANAVTKNWTTEFVRDFVDGGDGWYYYSKALGVNESVKILNSISLVDASYNKYDYDIAFRYEAVQASVAAASELWGGTAEIENGDVTWTF